VDKIEPLAVTQAMGGTFEAAEKKTLKQAHIASSA
jgi:hypothetical protein